MRLPVLAQLALFLTGAFIGAVVHTYVQAPPPAADLTALTARLTRLEQRVDGVLQALDKQVEIDAGIARLLQTLAPVRPGPEEPNHGH